MASEPLLARHDAVLLDLDGTVYHGNRPIPGAVEAIGRVREGGTPLRFVTNNAAKRPEDVAAHLRSLGVTANPAEIHTSAQAAASVLHERLPAGAEVLVVGTESLAAEVENAGLHPVREAGAGVVAVVQGHSRETGWPDLAEACTAIRAGALWIASNVDATLPSERGELPGNGAMVAALRTATGKEPDVAGKPRSPLLRAAAESASARDPLVVGDRLDTDIAGAVAAGFSALLVLSGVATPAELLRAGPDLRPRYVADGLEAVTAVADEVAVGPRPGWRIRHDGSALAVSSEGGPAGTDLLRALCAAAWQHDTVTLHPADPRAETALGDLDLL